MITEKTVQAVLDDIWAVNERELNCRKAQSVLYERRLSAHCHTKDNIFAISHGRKVGGVWEECVESGRKGTHLHNRGRTVGWK